MGSTQSFDMMAPVRLVLLALILLLLSSSATIFVNVNAPGSAQTGTAADPCLSLKCGLRLAVSDDVVSVAAGDYTGPDNCNLNVTAGKLNIQVKGQGLASQIVIRSTEPSTRAFVVAGGAISLLANLTLRDFAFHPISGYQSGSRSYVGGALSLAATNLTLADVALVNNSAVEGGAVGASHGSLLTLLRCSLSGNHALSGGGALSVDLSSLDATHSTFEFNTALGNPQAQSFGDGGAILAVAGTRDTLRLAHCTFHNNSAAEAGGAMHVQSVNLADNSLSLDHCDFMHNAVTGDGRCLSSTLCDVRGGAIYSSVPSSRYFMVNFLTNRAATSAVNQFAEGGALYSTSVYSDVASVLSASMQHCSFHGNYASGSGGAAYLLNQKVLMQDCILEGNVAGTQGSLFSDASTSGGALWYSAPASQSLLLRVNFTDNYVWGGWGGAIFGTDSPLPLLVEDCNFTSNTAFSSYTFVAQVTQALPLTAP